MTIEEYRGSSTPTRAHKNGRLEKEHVTPIEARSLGKENRTPGHVLSNNGLCICSVCVTIFSTGSKFRPVSNLQSYMLLL